MPATVAWRTVAFGCLRRRSRSGWPTAEVFSGCRHGELLGLRWADVDLARGMLAVRRSLVDARGGAPRFGKPWSVESLADLAHLFRSTFSERFAAAVGEPSPTTWRGDGCT
jgi:integrase